MMQPCLTPTLVENQLLEIFIQLKIHQAEMWCAEDNYSYMCNICAKAFLDLNFN